MQDPNVNRPPEERGPTVVNTSTRGGGTGGWAVAVIIAVLVAVGIFYFVGSGKPGGSVDTNANTSATGTQESAPAGGTATGGTTTGGATGGGATGGAETGTQPQNSQPAQGGGATTTTP
ncbi:hypothetical protein NN6n1_24140 [Shinella zoogloeoides]